MRGLSSRLSCYKVASGEPVFEKERLAGLKNVYASPVGVADQVYVTDRDGTTVVIKKSDTLEVLATNTSMVVVGDALFLKGDRYLYCIGE